MRILKMKHLLIPACVTVAAFALVPKPLAQSAPENQAGASSSQSLTADQIVANLVSHNQSRAANLHGYTGRRVYELHYHGFPSSKDAELVVEARYSAPANKQFTVMSQSGSRLIVDKVLKRLLTSEEEAQSSENRRQTALTPENYIFESAGERFTSQGHFYILKVKPRIKNKFLYRGEIWVDANDFAIARIEAEPAENPSFWISHTEIEQVYGKFGSFWLPVRNESTSKTRLGGTATLVIRYEDYDLSGMAKPNDQAALNEASRTF